MKPHCIPQLILIFYYQKQSFYQKSDIIWAALDIYQAYRNDCGKGGRYTWNSSMSLDDSDLGVMQT